MKALSGIFVGRTNKMWGRPDKGNGVDMVSLLQQSPEVLGLGDW